MLIRYVGSSHLAGAWLTRASRAMGTYTGNTAADLEYPLVFIESMAETLKTVSRANRFRYIHLSGKFVRQDQEEKLWFLETPRKLKVRFIPSSFLY